MHAPGPTTNAEALKWKFRDMGIDPALAKRERGPYKCGVEPIRYLQPPYRRPRNRTGLWRGFPALDLRPSAGGLALWAMVKRPVFSAWYGRRMSTPQSATRVAPFIDALRSRSRGIRRAPRIRSAVSTSSSTANSSPPPARSMPDESSVVFPGGRPPPRVSSRPRPSTGCLSKASNSTCPRCSVMRLWRRAMPMARWSCRGLCPVDYHRFHFPAAGVPGETRLIDGPLFSVSPIALRKRLAYLWTNKRTLTALETRRFGTVLLFEIGATCVGTIHQTFTARQQRGKRARKKATSPSAAPRPSPFSNPAR